MKLTGRTCRIRKYMLFFLKICTLWENYDFIEINFSNKVVFFSCDFDMFDGSIECATKFHGDEFFLFFSISVRSKVIAFFVQNLLKLNILSVIAIDLVKIFK